MAIWLSQLSRDPVAAWRQKGHQAFRLASPYVLCARQLERLTPALLFNARRVLLALSFLFLMALSSHAQDNLLVNEFMASNSQTLNDEDGASSDWIEIYNAGTNSVSLDGWYLTDTATVFTKWRFPNVALTPKGYLVVFASGKNRTNSIGRLHTNFQLAAGGEYLALVRPDGATVVSQFAPNFPAQQTDISYGRDRVSADILGYFLTPTPGQANATGGPGFAGSVQFSRSGGTFGGIFSLVLSNTVPAAAAVIRCTLDGAPPTNGSPTYTVPIAISTTTPVRARVFQTGLLPGPITSETYVALSSDVLGFSSDLPVVVLHNLHGGAVPTDGLQPVALQIFEPKGGRTSLTNLAAVSSRAGFRLRGSTSLEFPKSSFALETWDEYDGDKDMSLLGMPEESDWVLYAPNNYEPVLIHNPFMYELSNDLGRWAPRTRLVELYLNLEGGAVSSMNYNGVYVLIEKIKRSKDRVDIDKLEPEHTNPPQVTGGYILKLDRPEATDSGFQVPILTNVPQPLYPINYVDPEEIEIETPQRDPQEQYIRNYMTNFVLTLNGASFADPATGYAQFIDVASWLDHHILNVLAFNPDALRVSAYFYKPRAGKLVAGPIWDFDRSLGSTDGRDFNPRRFRAASGDVGTGTDFFNYHWWRQLFRDPDFWQQWIDRWQELRGDAFSTNRLFARIDLLADQVREAQAREVARWALLTRPRTGLYSGDGGYSFDFGDGSYQGEVDCMKQWLKDRLNFIDTNFLAAPVLSHPGGPIQSGFVLTISGPPGSIYYTLDGTDPRLPGGGLSSRALLYAGPITLTNNAWVVARVRDLSHTNLTGPNKPPLSSPWSGPAAATFVVSTPPLIITEIMYHPHDPPPGNTNDEDNFEFIELKNIGPAAMNLNGVRFTNGIEFNFTGSSVTNLGPGQQVLVVRNRAAFLSRYPGVSNIAGEYTGALDNGGERLYLEGPLREPILDFVFKDEWHPATDGLGFSLIIADENAPPTNWGFASGWRPSSTFGGSPGQDDPPPPAYVRVVINEALTHTDPPAIDAIELFNPSSSPADIGGWFLSDDLNQPTKFRIPDGTTIPAGQFRSFDEGHFNVTSAGGVPFSLSSQGDEVYLFSGDAGTNLTGYAHGFKFGAAANGVSFGRHVTSVGTEHFVAQSLNTPGASNAPPRVGPVVVNEIMYHPPDLRGGFDNQDDEFVELLNVSGAPVPLFDPAFPTNTWRLRDAVDFVIPPNVTLPAGGFLILVSFDPVYVPALNAFRAKYSVPATVPIFGPYRGKLDNSADNVELIMPDPPDLGQVPYVLVDKVDYKDLPPWAFAADGAGPSLQRRVATDYANDPANWMAAWPTAGSTNAGTAPPVITAQPTNQTVLAGQNAFFSVSVTSPAPLTYQWRVNGADVASATNVSLVLNNVQTNQAGLYSVAISNFAGVTQSSNAMLTVLTPTNNSAGPMDWAGCWKFEDGSGTVSADSSPNANHGRLVNGPVFTATGRVGGALSFDGLNDYVAVPDANVLEFAGRNFTVALWVKTTNSVKQALVEKQHSGYAGCFLLALNRDNYWTGGFSVWKGNEWMDSNWRGATDGQWHHLAVTYDGSAFRFYRDGQLDKTASMSAAFVATSYPLNFGRFATFSSGWPFSGQMDEICKFDRPLSLAEISSLAGAAPEPPPPPPARTLTVGSSNPNSGVAITVSPSDNNGQGNGSTLFTRSYSNTTVVTLTAPASVGTNGFVKWQRDGADLTTNLVANVTLDTDYILTAVFVIAPSTNTTNTTVGPMDWAGCWKFEDGSGTVAADSSPNANHGRLVNGPVFNATGRVGGALSFDGLNDYVTVPDADVLEFAGRNFTVALWVKTTSNVKQALVEKQHSGYTGCFLLALNRDDYWTGGFSVWKGNEWIDSNWRGAIDGQWHHLAVTYDGSAFRFYRDGQLDKTASMSAAFVATSYPLNFGRFATFSSGWPFSGQMDEICKFDRPLSLAEISSLAGAAPGPPLPPPIRTLTVGSSNPNSVVGVTVSPNDNNGQGNGTTLFTRAYSNNTVVTLTAPATAGANNFQKWQRDGVDAAFTATTMVTMDANHTLTAVYAATNSTNNAELVGYWKFNDGSGLTALDASGLGHHGALTNGPVFTNGQCAGALFFDGNNDFVRVPDANLLDFNGKNFTVALRVKTTKSSPQALVEKQHSSFSGMFLIAINRDNAVPGGFSVWKGNAWIDSNFRGVTDGQWHHLAVTFDGTRFRLYRDGILDKTVTNSASYVNTSQPLNFGRFGTSNQGWPFGGLMDEVRRYNRVLSDAEVAGLTSCPSIALASSLARRDGARVELRITSVRVLENEQVSLWATGQPGRTYYIQASTTLQNWSTIATAVAGPDGSFEFADSDASQFGTRFYRLVER